MRHFIPKFCSCIEFPSVWKVREKLGRANSQERFLFSLFEYESSCHVSTAQKSEIFIISTFPAGRADRSAPCPARVKFRSVEGILNSFRQLHTPGTDATPFRYFRLRDRPTFAFSGTPLRNLTFFTSPTRINISRKPNLTNRLSRIWLWARKMCMDCYCVPVFRLTFKVYE